MPKLSTSLLVAGNMLSFVFSIFTVKCNAKDLQENPQHLPIPDLLNGAQEDMEGFLTKPMIWLGKRVMKVKKNDKA